MSRNSRLTDWTFKNLDVAVLPIALILITLVMGSFNPEKFYSLKNARSIAFQLPELGLFSLAMMIAMITGGINLSIISAANLTNVLMALVMTRFIPADSGSHWLAVAAVMAGGLVASALLGLFNGIFIARVGVSPVLTTIGTMFFYEGLALALTKGYVISDFPAEFVALGNELVLGVPAPFFLLVISAFVLWLIFRGTPFGRYLFMMGSNKAAVEYSGIDVKKALVKTYMLSGVYAGLAGLVMTARFNSANARYGNSYLLVTVLVSVLGGADPDGGFGKISGIMIALLTLQVLTSGLNLMKASPFITVALWGALLILVISYRRFAVERRDRWLSKNAQ